MTKNRGGFAPDATGGAYSAPLTS